MLPKLVFALLVVIASSQGSRVKVLPCIVACQPTLVLMDYSSPAITKQIKLPQTSSSSGYFAFFSTYLEKEAAKVEGFEVGVQKPSYYVRLGSLSSKVRTRAYQQALNKVRDVKQKSQETISQLHHTVSLVSLSFHLSYKKQMVAQF